MNKEELKRRIIVDFDDTLCLHNNTNIEDGLPNTNLINTLNKLFVNGHIISIYTARGHFSANNREHAEELYRPVIEKWLDDNNVFYHELSFNKPYGIIYIDDKAIRPNEIDKIEELL